MSCKEDLDEARAALATSQRDRDALHGRVAGLENELAAARAELAKLKAAAPVTVGAPCGVTVRAATAAGVSPSMAGKTGLPHQGHIEAVPPKPLTTERPRS